MDAILQRALQWIAEIVFRSAPWTAVIRALSSPKGALLMILVPAGILLAFLAPKYFQRTQQFEDLVTRTLGSRLEATPQEYKGLEAFMLSLTTELSPPVGDCEASDELIEVFEAIASRLKQFQLEPQQGVGPELKLVDRAAHDILTDRLPNKKTGFLFVPSSVLTTPLTAVERAELKDSSRTTTADADILASNPHLERDIRLGLFLAPELTRLAGTRVTEESTEPFRNRPAQVYLITKNGTNRIFDERSVNPEDIYRDQFSSTTFFPSRPYFWPAVHSFGASTFDAIAPSPAEPLKSSFYVSKPYIDIGGHGLVITVARGISIPGLSDAAICMDLPLLSAERFPEDLARALDKLGSNHEQLKCSAIRKGIKTTSALHGGPPDQVHLANAIETYVVNHKGNLASVFGNVSVLERREDGALVVALPISRTTLQNDDQGEFFVFDVNVGQFRSQTTLLALATAGTLGLILATLVGLLMAELKKRQQTIASFDSVGRVMSFSPAPYVRLDRHDRIVDANEAFASMAGIDDDATVQLTFRDCLRADSYQQYEQVQRQREEQGGSGAQVLAYKIGLRGREDDNITISAVVPSNVSGQLPETFGLVLNFADARSALGDSLTQSIEDGEIVALPSTAADFFPNHGAFRP